MTKSRRNLRAFGAAGLAIGSALALGAPLGGDLDGLLRGYGLMLVASAGYMLAGLWVLGLRRPNATARPNATVMPNGASGEALHQV